MLAPIPSSPVPAQLLPCAPIAPIGLTSPAGAKRAPSPVLASTPETIALYITDLASRPLVVATIVRRLTAISKAHAAAGHSSPASTRNLVVGDTLRGIKRTLGTAQHKKEALLAKDIRHLVAACPKDLAGTRDKALLLISFAGAFRRSESSGLNLKICSSSVRAWSVLCVGARQIRRAPDARSGSRMPKTKTSALSAH